jgi:uncharacterized protein
MTAKTQLLSLSVVVLASALTCVLTAAASPAAAQSFNCRRASEPAERAICTNARLGGLDQRMSRLYAKLMARLDRDDQRDGLRDYQMRFLSSRDRCGSDVSCIKGAYLDQIDVLASRLRYAQNGWDQ